MKALHIAPVTATGRLLSLVLVLLVSGCATTRLVDVEAVHETALPPSTQGPLYELAMSMERENGRGGTACLPLVSNPEALAWRLLLAEMATSSIDAQYYLWDGDESGRLLLTWLLDAADRGVRVRLLVDDVFTLKADEAIATLDSHPNVSVRIFNPWQRRGGMWSRAFEFLGSFEQLNQRMHNKQFVVDNRVAIVGGRNIGNPYFGLSEKYNFRDLELIAVGPVAEDIADSFDLYWNDDWSTPGEAFAGGGELPDLGELRQGVRDAPCDPAICERLQTNAAGQRILLERLRHASAVGDAWVVYDDPPSQVAADAGVRKVEKLRDLDADITRELMIASAYFIPGEEFLQTLARLAGEGVRVVVLTNSLASTNHTVVNSGYSPWRRRLLRAGVELYEYSGDPAGREGIVVAGIDGGMITLHTKTFVIDREMVYIGSLNMDPRSLHINTEMGLLLQDRQLAEAVAGIITHDASPENAWRVRMDEEERLYWESASGTVHLQPARHFGQRIADFFYSLLPIKDQL